MLEAPLRHLVLVTVLCSLAVLASATALAQQPEQIVELGGQWRFARGDDLAWAARDFDDSHWETIQVPGMWAGTPYGEAGGFAWYRARVTVPESMRGRPLSLYFETSGVCSFEIYAGGVLAGTFGSLPPDTRFPGPGGAVFRLPERAIDANGTLVIAARIWQHPRSSGWLYIRGGLEVPPMIGDEAVVDRLADGRRSSFFLADAPLLVMAVLFSVIGLYNFHLARHRVSRDYFWLGLLAFGYTLNSLCISSWGHALLGDRLLTQRINHVVIHLVSIIVGEFLWTFLNLPLKPWLRLIQLAHLVLAIVLAVEPDVSFNPTTVRWRLMFALSTAPVTIWFIVRAWWAGNPDARALAWGVALFVLFAAADMIRGFQTTPTLPKLGGYTFAVFLLSVAVAISDRFRRVHEELDALKDDLEKQVERRTHELTEARNAAVESEQRAIDANRAKSTFLANMSHELRTPLNAILGFAQVLDREAGVPPARRRGLTAILRSGEHLLGLINDVLSIAKIEAGQLTLVEAPFDLRQLLRSLEELFRQRAEMKELSLVFDLSSSLPHRVLGDEGKLRQVLVNLLGNAIKFTHEGRVTLRASWRNELATFEIEDTGEGIAIDEFSGLFQEFSQTEAGRRSGEGTGLGLAISRSIVLMMGGDILVQSARGKGSTFTAIVRLPAVDQDVPVASDRPVVGLEPNQPEWRILIVDDVADNREVLRRILEPLGFALREASDGQQAIEIHASWSPHLILMDERLPGLDGTEATRRIRSAECGMMNDELAESRKTSDIHHSAFSIQHSTKIIAVSTSALDHERETILAAGCDAFLAKPFAVETLFEMLVEHLGVRFVRADPIVDTPACAADDRARTLKAQLETLAADERAQLAAALAIGDLQGALQVVGSIEERDATLAEMLRDRIEGYRFNEILDSIE